MTHCTHVVPSVSETAVSPLVQQHQQLHYKTDGPSSHHHLIHRELAGMALTMVIRVFVVEVNNEYHLQFALTSLLFFDRANILKLQRSLN